MSTLRVGLLLDGRRLRRWQLACVETLLERRDITVELAICNRAPIARTTGLRKQFRRIRNLPGRLHELPWTVVNRLDQRFARRDRSGAAAMVESVDLAALPVDVPVLEVAPEASPSGLIHRLSEPDVAAIERYDLDVILRFGFNILKGPVLESARHGVWSFHHADNRINRGGPPGFWEVALDSPVTGAIVQRLNEQLDNGEVLARAWYSTNPVSWNRNFHRVLARSMSLLTDAVSHLAHHGEAPAPPHEPASIYCHPLYRKPSAAVALTTAARCYGRRFRGKFQKTMFRPQWHLRWGDTDAHDASVHRLHRVTPPPDRFWADPFPCRRDGKTWLFVEELIYETNRGRIAALQVDGDRVNRHAVALDLPYHVSYPFLFEHDGSLYMIPESCANRTIELWRCTRFPDAWEKARNVMEGVNAVDTTLLAHDQRYYLFTNLARGGSIDHNFELHVFFADDPLSGEWHPHPHNPVVVDSRCARMAGGFITGTDGCLIRCAQLNGTRYGEAISLRAITTLSPKHYSERPVGHITPEWESRLLGTHHFSSEGRIVALDACASISRWRKPDLGHSLAAASPKPTRALARLLAPRV